MFRTMQTSSAACALCAAAPDALAGPGSWSWGSGGCQAGAVAPRCCTGHVACPDLLCGHILPALKSPPRGAEPPPPEPGGCGQERDRGCLGTRWELGAQAGTSPLPWAGGGSRFAEPALAAAGGQRGEHSPGTSHPVPPARGLCPATTARGWLSSPAAAAGARWLRGSPGAGMARLHPGPAHAAAEPRAEPTAAPPSPRRVPVLREGPWGLRSPTEAAPLRRAPRPRCTRGGSSFLWSGRGPRGGSHGFSATPSSSRGPRAGGPQLGWGQWVPWAGCAWWAPGNRSRLQPPGAPQAAGGAGGGCETGRAAV